MVVVTSRPGWDRLRWTKLTVPWSVVHGPLVVVAGRGRCWWQSGTRAKPCSVPLGLVSATLNSTAESHIGVDSDAEERDHAGGVCE